MDNQTTKPDTKQPAVPDPQRDTFRALVLELHGRIDEFENLESLHTALQEMLGLAPGQPLTAALNAKLNENVNAMTALAAVRRRLDNPVTEVKDPTDPTDIVMAIHGLQVERSHLKGRLQAVRRELTDKRLALDFANDRELEIRALFGATGGDAIATIDLVRQELDKHQARRRWFEEFAAPAMDASSKQNEPQDAGPTVPNWKEQVRLFGGMLERMVGRKLTITHHTAFEATLNIGGENFTWRGTDLPALAELAMLTAAGEGHGPRAMGHRSRLVDLLASGFASVRREAGPVAPANHVRLEVPPEFLGEPTSAARPEHPAFRALVDKLRRMPAGIAGAIQAAVDLVPVLIDRRLDAMRCARCNAPVTREICGPCDRAIASEVGAPANADAVAPAATKPCEDVVTWAEATELAATSAARYSAHDGAPSYLSGATHPSWRPHDWVVDAVVAGAIEGQRRLTARRDRLIALARRALLAGSIRQIPWSRLAAVAEAIEREGDRRQFSAAAFLTEVAPRYGAGATAGDPVREIIEHALRPAGDGLSSTVQAWLDRLHQLAHRLRIEVLGAEAGDDKQPATGAPS